jgi:hypothetical protein
MGVETGGKRPGGLTALAVLNFVFGGLGLIGILGMLALLSAADTLVREGTRGEKSLTDHPGTALIYLGILVGLIACALLIVSGVGYLGQKKVLGKGLGTAYGVLALVSTSINLAALHQSFTIFTIIGLIYPVLTLILLHTVFKDDFPY